MTHCLAEVVRGLEPGLIRRVVRTLSKPGATLLPQEQAALRQLRRALASWDRQAFMRQRLPQS